MVARLGAADIENALQTLPGWTVEGGKLFKEFRFADFARAFAFMTSVATYAEAANHHPEWFNVYAAVKVWLTTHDVQGISERDLEMARRMDDLSRDGRAEGA